MEDLKTSLVNVMTALMSVDNNARKAAESYFSMQLAADCMSMVQCLLNIFADASVSLSLRNFAGILLRRAIEKSSFSPELTAELRVLLLQLWRSEKERMLLKRLAHILAQSAMNSSWLELVPQIVDHAKNTAAQEGSEGALLSALLLIETVAEYCPADVLTHVQILGMFLSSNLGSNSAEIQIACARTCCASIVALEDSSARDSFKPAIQPIINIVGTALSKGDEIGATSVNEYLVSIAQLQPIFFKGNLDAVVQAMLSVAHSDDLEFSTRSMALELMVTLSETAPALARRCPGLVQGLVPLAMNMMRDVEISEEEWLGGKYENESPDEDYFVGEEAIERAAAGMGGRILGPVVINLVQEYSKNGDWTYRRAAVAAICRLAEGSQSGFKSYFTQAVQFLSDIIRNDVSARVKFQAVEAVGRFAALFTSSTNFQTLFSSFVPLLTRLLGDASICDKLRGHVTSALINLTNPENCEEEYLIDSGMLEPLLSALVVCLQGASVQVQPYCLDLLGCVASSSGEVFAKYYPSFMPGIKQILISAQGSPDLELIKLRGKAMNCIGLVGEAVGADIFANDAMEVMNLLLQDLNGNVAAGGNLHDQDVAFDYILPACARIAKALGRAFKPFVPAVMEPILRGASQQITCTIEDASEEDVEGEVAQDEETGLESAVISTAGVKKRVTMNTYAVHQKDQAARMLFEFAEALKGEMASHLVSAMEVVISMVTDKHSSDVRASSSLALAKLFEASIDALSRGYPLGASLDSSQIVASVLQSSLNKLLESLKGEINASARSCSADCLKDILQACFNSSPEAADGSREASRVIVRPDINNSQVIINDLLSRCSESVTRRLEKERAFAENEGLEAEDADALTEQVEEEEEVLTNIASSIGILLQLHSDTGALMPLFDSAVIPLFAPYLFAPGTPNAKKQHCEHFQIVATCLMDDVCEYGGVSAQKYIAQCVNQMLENCATSDNNVIRQCSSYGLAQIIRQHSDALLHSLSGDISCLTNALVSLINREDASDEDNEGCTENAVYALGLLVSMPTFRECVNSMKNASSSLIGLTQTWLHGLPLKADEQESKRSSYMLCRAVEACDMNVLGGTAFTNLPQILNIFAEIIKQASKLERGVLYADDEVIYATKETVVNITSCVKALASGSLTSVPLNVIQNAFSQLGTPQQSILNAAV